MTTETDELTDYMQDRQQSSDTPRLPEMAGSTDFYSLLGQALAEAKAERGMVQITMNHPTMVRIKILSEAPDVLNGGGFHFQLRRELTHYL